MHVIKIKTSEIELAIAKFFGIRQNIIVPNLSWGLGFKHELDLAVITKSCYLHEYEIKTSVGDLKKDLEKPHLHRDKLNRIRTLNFVIPDYLYKYKDYIPEHAGIYCCEKLEKKWMDRPQIVMRQMRSPKPYKDARKLNQNEINKLLELSNLRIWSLKEKLAKLQK